jgi:hypothetical protein
MPLLRRLRAAASTALVWGGMYAIAGAVFNLMQNYWGHAPLPLGEIQTGWIMFRWAVIGAISGGVFATLFRWAERRSTFAELRMPRVAALGFVGGIALPALNSALVLSGLVPEIVPLGTLVVLTAFGGMLGSACAATWLGLARNARVSDERRQALVSGPEAGLLASGGIPLGTLSRARTSSSIPRS